MSKITEQTATRAPRDPDARRALILAAAERRLIAHGANGFSMRAVAAEGGISLSHLQYYFPNIDALQTGMARRWSDRFRSRFFQDSNKWRATKEKWLDTFVALMLDELATPAGSLGMWEFWMLGARDKSAARVLRAMYSALYDSLADCLGDVYPSRSRGNNLARAKVIVGLMEGVGILSSHAINPAAARRELRATLCQAVAAIAANS